MNLEEKTNALLGKAAALDLQCIVYTFESTRGGQGGGFARNVDMGDALVAIERIIKQFDISKEALSMIWRNP